MNIGVDFLPEPKLQFGDFFEHEDTKTGLAEFGPFGKSVSGLHPSEIRVGFVGTRETIAGAQELIEGFGTPIESENIKRLTQRPRADLGGLFGGDGNAPTEVVTRLEKILNRDFVGFSRDSPFRCCFQLNERWERRLDPRQIKKVLEIKVKEDRIWRLVELIDSEIENLANTGPSPDVIILALTPEMVEEAHSVRVEGNFHLNLRSAIKACAMKWGVPVQLLRRRTVTGGADLQERATRAWNFCTAQYYKADGIPWRPMALESNVCFVGIGFYVAHEKALKRTAMRSSVAQAFDHLGQGLVLRGDPFEWDEERQGRSPHLTQEAARLLIRDVLKEYVSVSGQPPRRVVIHKTSGFWGAEHGSYNELDGFYAGIDEVFPGCESDLVALYRPGLRLFREGIYPPLRGTYFHLEGRYFLYTMGFIPYLETYPGSYVPEPWGISEHHGGSSPKDLLREILMLTKMNVNNCAFADGTPITIGFADAIGKIMKHIPEGGTVQAKYKFYM